MLYRKTLLLLLTSLIPVSIFYVTGLIELRIGSLQILPLISLASLIVRMMSYHILKKDTVLFSSYKQWLTILGILLLILFFTIITLWQIEPKTIWSIFLGLSFVLIFIFYALTRTELVISTHWILIREELVLRSEVQVGMHDNVLIVENEKTKLKMKIRSHKDEIKRVLEIEEEGIGA